MSLDIPHIFLVTIHSSLNVDLSYFLHLRLETFIGGVGWMLVWVEEDCGWEGGFYSGYCAWDSMCFLVDRNCIILLFDNS